MYKPIKGIILLQRISEDTTRWTTYLDSKDEEQLKRIIDSGEAREFMLGLLAGGLYSTLSAMQSEGKGTIEERYADFKKTMEWLMDGNPMHPWMQFG